MQTFTTPLNTTYKIECWGASGGYRLQQLSRAGYGGYSVGQISLSTSTNLYISVGQEGKSQLDSEVGERNIEILGGWNGGGNGMSWGDTKITSSGGGATSVQYSLIDDGQLKRYSNNRDDVIIVAGGGGGTGGETLEQFEHNGGDGGGYIGGTSVNKIVSLNASGGTQNTGGSSSSSSEERIKEHSGFGTGESPKSGNSSGGGGGWYGGGMSQGSGGNGGGGSGYIGNSSLSHKYMVIYKGTTSATENTKTIQNAKVSSTAKSDYAKSGNGCCIISWISPNL